MSMYMQRDQSGKLYCSDLWVFQESLGLADQGGCGRSPVGKGEFSDLCGVGRGTWDKA